MEIVAAVVVAVILARVCASAGDVLWSDAHHAKSAPAASESEGQKWAWAAAAVLILVSLLLLSGLAISR